MAKGRRHLYEVRFRQGGKVKSFRAAAASPEQAASKIHSNGGQVIRVTKAKK